MTFFPRFLATQVAAVCTAAAALAAPGQLQDLGQGLAYFRVHALADDAKTLETALAADGPLVLDVRYASARPEDALPFAHALAGHTGPALLCVLVSPSTPPELVPVFASAHVRLIMLGIADSVPRPQVVVEQAPETDRRAYDALDSGTPLTQLISGKIKKERYDEVSLLSDFNNGNTSGEPPDPDLKTIKAAPTGASALIDCVLQRAVDLDRALAAIKPRS